MSDIKGSNSSQDEKDVLSSKFTGTMKTASIKSGSVIPVELDDVDEKIEGGYLGSTQQHPFSLPVDAIYWGTLYEIAKYEGRHRFDALFQWDSSEEKRLVRKLNIYIMVWVWIMFSSLDLIRRNVNRAVSDNMLPELGMNTNDLNTGQTIYLCSFLAAELPGGLLSKRIGPDVMTPICIVVWGIICACQSVITNKTGFFITRALLGLSQGGFIPEMVLYLSYFFKSNELPIRLSIFWTAIPVTQIIGALLAAGFLKMRGILGWSGWQWLFLIEGLMSVVVGLATFFVMPASVTETKKIFRGKASWLHGKTGWFSEHEEKILVNRILRDDPSKGDMNNRQHVSLKGIWAAIKDVDLLPIYLLGIVAFIPFQPAANYLSLTLRNLGYSVFEANMLAIPGYFLFFINILVVVWLSEKYKERLLFAALSNVWVLPFLIGLIVISKKASPWIRYALLTGVNGEPYSHAILVGMTSRNSNSVSTRAVSAAVYNICYQIGSIDRQSNSSVAVNLYRDNDKPYYYRGNRILVGLASANIVLFVLAKLYYMQRNKQKAKRWEGLSSEEQENYLTSTKDTGAKRLNVMFAH